MGAFTAHLCSRGEHDKLGRGYLDLCTMSSAYANGWGSHRVACMFTSTTRVDFEHFMKTRSRSLTPRLREDVRVEQADVVLKDELCNGMPDPRTHLG